MGKIRINLASGANSEKPLINAFLENNNSYVVLDNEMNGSMGLPIILVSKLENNKLVKITDQSEWQIVKEYLKNIIAGNKVEFIKINNEILADDIYYTQLTLPVPSFDALKNAYPFKEESIENMANPIENVVNNQVEVTPNVSTTQDYSTNQPVQNKSFMTPVEAQTNTPVEQVGIMDAPINIVSQVDNNPQPIAEAPVETPINVEAPNAFQETPSEPIVNINTPVVDINIPSVNASVTPEVSEEPAPQVVPEVTPTEFQNVEMPQVSSVEPQVEQSMVNLDNPLLNNLNTPIQIDQQAVEKVKEPEITPTPIIDTPIANMQSTPIVEESIFKEQKEAFMQACENMFDALVQKFEKELENRK